MVFFLMTVENGAYQQLSRNRWPEEDLSHPRTGNSFPLNRLCRSTLPGHVRFDA
jgi:hypothetical protein